MADLRKQKDVIEKMYSSGEHDLSDPTTREEWMKDISSYRDSISGYKPPDPSDEFNKGRQWYNPETGEVSPKRIPGGLPGRVKDQEFIPDETSNAYRQWASTEDAAEKENEQAQDYWDSVRRNADKKPDREGRTGTVAASSRSQGRTGRGHQYP